MKGIFISEQSRYIVEIVFGKLSDQGQKPRTVLNVLSLIEFLLKNGSQIFKVEMEEEKFLVKKQLNFYSDNDDEDLGKSIQILAQRILSLFEKPDELRNEREEAKKLRDRIKGFSCEASKSYTPFTEDNKYGGISSDDYANSYRDSTIRNDPSAKR